MRRVSITLLALLIVLVVLVGLRYQWTRSHRANRSTVTMSQRDSLHRDSTANEPADTTCFASRLGFPCDS